MILDISDALPFAYRDGHSKVACVRVHLTDEVGLRVRIQVEHGGEMDMGGVDVNVDVVFRCVIPLANKIRVKITRGLSNIQLKASYHWKKCFGKIFNYIWLISHAWQHIYTEMVLQRTYILKKYSLVS